MYYNVCVVFYHVIKYLRELFNEQQEGTIKMEGQPIGEDVVQITFIDIFIVMYIICHKGFLHSSGVETTKNKTFCPSAWRGTCVYTSLYIVIYVNKRLRFTQELLLNDVIVFQSGVTLGKTLALLLTSGCSKMLIQELSYHRLRLCTHLLNLVTRTPYYVYPPSH